MPIHPSSVTSKTPSQLHSLSTMLSTNIRILSSTLPSLKTTLLTLEKSLTDSTSRLSIFSSPPYLIASVQELLYSPSSSSSSKPIGIIIKTSTRNTVFVPVQGLLDFSTLTPSTLIGVNRDTYIPLSLLPLDHDLAAKLSSYSPNSNKEEKTDFNEIGGCSKQIEELRESIALPLLYPERLREFGVSPSKGVLLYGPPGTGKTLLVRALASSLNCSFFKISASSLAQSFVGSGAALVKSIFSLAREKAPSIVFIDEIDAIGGRRSSGDDSGSREITRTLLELLNCIDGFEGDGEGKEVKVVGCSNRVDILDPALMRSGRLDRKIEFKLPGREEREEILRIHLRGMKVGEEVEEGIGEISEMCEGFNGAMIKAVCVEGGMSAVRKGKGKVGMNEMVEGVGEVKEKRIKKFSYFA